jgi:hypothetical protein
MDILIEKQLGLLLKNPKDIHLTFERIKRALMRQLRIEFTLVSDYITFLEEYLEVHENTDSSLLYISNYNGTRTYLTRSNGDRID